MDLKLIMGGPGKHRKPKGRRVSFSKQLTTELRTPSPVKRTASRSPPNVRLAAVKEKRSRGPRVKAERAAAKKAAGKRKGASKKAAAKKASKKAVKKGGRRVRKAGKALKRGLRRRIDFSKIRWGTFTKRFLSWKRRHPRAKVNTLREFAAYVLAHPDKFSLRARRKALFYRNIILKGKVNMPIAKYHGRKSRTTLSRKSRRSKVSRR